MQPLREGQLHCRLILEIVGWPKEHIEKALDLVLDKLKKEKGLTVVKEKKKEAKKISEKMWSTFAEFDCTVSGLGALLGLIFDYMPSSVEIIAPEDKITENRAELQDLLNDLIAKLHAYDAAVKKLKAMNILLQRELNKLKKA